MEESDALKLHRQKKGKLAVASKVPLRSRSDLALAYTPGVAEVSSLLAKHPEKVYDYTWKSNSLAVVSDGSAVLGLGNIGAVAALPVMEGKAVLFKELANIDAVPICIASQDVTDIIKTVENIAPAFGAINLEDIAAPKCFEIEAVLKSALDIPVMHDDQHGTAVVVLAAFINALKVVSKQPERVRVVIAGAGAAGIAVVRMLLNNGVKDILMVDSRGIISKDREDLNPVKKEIADQTNHANLIGSLQDAIQEADVFIGVSKGNTLTKEMVQAMNKDAIIFAMANPVPEILPDIAKYAGARIVGTGRSDFPNQINNSLGFPGIFRGALDVRASEINEEMKLAAAHALAQSVAVPSEEMILPEPLDKDVPKQIAQAVAEAARKTGVARI